MAAGALSIKAIRRSPPSRSGFGVPLLGDVLDDWKWAIARPFWSYSGSASSRRGISPSPRTILYCTSKPGLSGVAVVGRGQGGRSSGCTKWN